MCSSCTTFAHPAHTTLCHTPTPTPPATWQPLPGGSYGTTFPLARTVVWTVGSPPTCHLHVCGWLDFLTAPTPSYLPHTHHTHTTLLCCCVWTLILPLPPLPLYRRGYGSFLHFTTYPFPIHCYTLVRILIRFNFITLFLPYHLPLPPALHSSLAPYHHHGGCVSC